MSKQYRQRGFTLVELLAVLAILATLAGLSLPSIHTALQSAALVKVRADLRALDCQLALAPGTPPAPLRPPVLLAGAADSYRLDGEHGRAYLPVTVGGHTVPLYSDSPWPR